MTLSLLRLTDFRNISHAELSFSPHLNLIFGSNGSGKTSILEAIYYLSHGRSFRTPQVQHLIKKNSSKFSLFSQIDTAQGVSLPVGYERNAKNTSQLRMNGRDVTSFSELTSLLPLRMLNSQMHQLLEGGPQIRRKFLDWGLYYTNEKFMDCWRQYERVLKQRNLVLKSLSVNNLQNKRGVIQTNNEDLKKMDLFLQLKGWTQQIITHGDALNQMRKEYISHFTPLFFSITEQLLPELDLKNSLKISYDSGWEPNEGTYANALENSVTKELYLGYTSIGPHHAEVHMEINSHPVKHFLSRGQQKLLICAMMLAQGLLLSKHRNKQLIYLIDDLPSELDVLSCHKMMTLLSQQKAQIFITVVESETISNFKALSQPNSFKMFHVEQGQIEEYA